MSTEDLSLQENTESFSGRLRILLNNYLGEVAAVASASSRLTSETVQERVENLTAIIEEAGSAAVQIAIPETSSKDRWVRGARMFTDRSGASSIWLTVDTTDGKGGLGSMTEQEWKHVIAGNRLTDIPLEDTV